MFLPQATELPQEVVFRIAAGRMQNAAMHNALTAVRAYLDNIGKLDEGIAQRIDEALSFGEPVGHALFANLRTLCNAAQDPDRVKDISEIAGTIEVLLANHDGTV